MKVNYHKTSKPGCEGSCCTRVEHVSVRAGVDTILEDVNLHTHCGETTAIVGPNGAGKSTLMKAILGELPHTGRIHFVSASGAHSARPIIGYVPQMPKFDRNYPATVCDLFAACTSRFPVWFPHGKHFRESVAEALREVDMEDCLDRRVGILSGGELQRILLALALKPTPQILLLDEPSSGIDIRGLHLYYETVEKVKQITDLSVLLISHDPALVRQYADRAVLLYHRVLKTGTPDEVLDSPEYRDLLG